jgi:hypothetical protein
MRLYDNPYPESGWTRRLAERAGSIVIRHCLHNDTLLESDDKWKDWWTMIIEVTWKLDVSRRVYQFGAR